MKDTIAKAFEESKSDKQWNHNYSYGYAEIFKELNVKSLLEIGIANHTPEISSLTAWVEIFPEASIFGADVMDFKLINNERIKSFKLDQSSLESLNEFKINFNKKLDIIIDDGSHIFEHAKQTFEQLFDLLSDNGVYIIEDIAKNMDKWHIKYEQTVQQWKEYLDQLTDFEYTIYDCKPEELDDSILIAIKRKK